MLEDVGGRRLRNLSQLLNCSDLDERFGLVVDIHINELQLVVHNCDAKAVHFNEPSISLLA